MKKALSQQKQSANRVTSADSLRGIAAVLVIAGHLFARDMGDLATQNHFRNLLYCFHMPVFFFWAGFFSKSGFNKSFGAFTIQKALRLLVPYITWSSVAVVAKLLFAILKSSQIAWVDQLNSWAHTLLYADSVWFFLSLFCMHLLFWGLYNVAQKSRLLAIIIGIIVYLAPMPTLLSMHNTQVMLPFFAVGLIAGIHWGEISAWANSRKWIRPAAVAAAIIAAPAADYFCQWRLGYGVQLVCSTITSIIFAGAMCLIFEMIMDTLSSIRKLFTVMGKYSMEVYCIHMLFVNYIPVSIPERIMEMPELVIDIIYFALSLIIAGACAGLSFAILNRIPIYRWFMLGQFPNLNRTRKDCLK